jgi:hypothetical protein
MAYVMVGALGAALSSTATKTLQDEANQILTPQGYNPITVDGIIGPKTCGALQETAKFDGGALLGAATQEAGGSLTTLCPTSTPPTLKAGATPGQVIDLDALPGASPPPAAAPQPATSSVLSTRNIMIAGGVVAGIIVLVYASKRKPKKAAAAA